MAALIKYADSDKTKYPGSDDEKSNKAKKNGNAKSQQQNVTGHNGHNQGNNGKRRHPAGGCRCNKPWVCCPDCAQAREQD